MSYSVQILGWFSAAMARASLSNRSLNRSAEIFRATSRRSRKSRAVAVGTTISRCPPHRPVLALISAHGSYLGCGDFWRRNVHRDRGAGLGQLGSENLGAA